MGSLYIGLISGTSVDGIDAALVDFDHQAKVLATSHTPISAGLQANLLGFNSKSDNELERLAECDVALGRLLAEVVNKLLEHTPYSASDITAIGSHGQTIRHYPATDAPTTMQIGDPNIIAELTGITTVADFRRRDMAAGGQGAPLVPAFHKAVFHSCQHNRVILNLGGIANITVLPAGKSRPVTGFDTGPANGLLDAWVERHLKLAYDRDGEWGTSGSSHPGLLERLMNDPYFAATPPKSTGREYFNLNWLSPRLEAYPHLAPRDVQATLVELTARSVSEAIANYAPASDEVLNCGGGVHNLYLMQRLQELLTPCRVTTTAEAGIDPDYVEAMAFAWLARQTLNHLPGNLSAVTGASGERILGGIYQA